MNNDGNKTTRKLEDSPKSAAGSMTAVRPSGWKKLLSKRWVFPAAYMAAAAIIVTILWLYSGTGQNKDDAVPGLSSAAGEESEAGASGEAVEAAANGETLRWPVAKMDEMTTVMSFYDASASEEERQAAMVEYNNTFTPHTAIDLARKDAKEFDVLAAMSGKVIVAEPNPVNGSEITIQHDNSRVTVYQSLGELQVKVGDTVEQGDIIAKAGRSEIEPDEGYHVHFEVRDNGQSVNPESLIKAQ